MRGNVWKDDTVLSSIFSLRTVLNLQKWVQAHPMWCFHIVLRIQDFEVKGQEEGLIPYAIKPRNQSPGLGKETQ